MCVVFWLYFVCLFFGWFGLFVVFEVFVRVCGDVLGFGGVGVS